MSRLFAELKRRNVFRVGAAYLVVAWLLIEVSDTVFPRLGLPEWTVTLVIALVIIAFPLALFLAWAFELTPEGVKRTEDVDVEASVTPHTGRKLDRFIVVGLLAVITILVVERVWFMGDSASPDARQDAQQITEAVPVEAGSVVAADTQAGSSIAVLPFVNMSPDPENAFFADGISEELLNILAGIDGLKVASRTSAFSFKGKDTPIPEIARQLGVRHVLEGSVRKQGNRVRITAQLVEAGHDAHLWSQTYERELVDIFRVQEEIARAIIAALEQTLGIHRVSVVAPTRDLAAYERFLRGRSRFYQRGFELDGAIEDLEFVVERDPDFAEAWAFLAAATGVVAAGGYPTRHDRAGLASRSEIAADRAFELDPGIPLALAGKGRTLVMSGQAAAGLELLERAALEVVADTSPRLWLGITLSELGHVERALPWFESAQALDPLVAINNGYLGYAYAAMGREAEGVRFALRAVELNPAAVYWSDAIGIDAANRGDLARAREMLLHVGSMDEEVRGISEAVAEALGDPSLRASLVVDLPADTADDIHTLVVVLLYLGAADRLFEVVRQATESGQNQMRFAAWMPSLGWLREDPRFFEFMREKGVVAYWEAEGYPTGCRPLDDPAGRRLDCSEQRPAAVTVER